MYRLLFFNKFQLKQQERNPYNYTFEISLYSNYNNFLGVVDILSWWPFSDIFEEQGKKKTQTHTK
jgi:hypothetical protein